MTGGYLALIKGLFGRKTVEDDPYQMPDAGRLGCADRAGRASPRAGARLGHSATITDAINETTPGDSHSGQRRPLEGPSCAHSVNTELGAVGVQPVAFDTVKVGNAALSFIPRGSSEPRPRDEGVQLRIDARPIRDPIRRAKHAKLFGENPPHDGADNA